MIFLIFETLAAFAALILALNVAAALVLAVYLCRPKKRTYLDDYTFTPFETGVDYEPVSFSTTDGVELSGWWLAGRTDRVVVGLTGRSGTRSDLLGVGTYLAKAGFHVLLFDFRGRGASARAALDLGRREAVDAAVAVDYAAARVTGAKIGVIGFSLGAAVAVMTAARDARVLSLVMDCPFARSEAMMRFGMRQFFPITRALLIPRLTRFWAMILYGFDLGGIDIPARAGGIGARRALVIVSGRDSVVPPAQQRSVYEALPCPKELWEEPEADHCGAYFADRERYVARVIAFFTETLGAP
jgi:pimeloyl-ACP methyl ester carboxylesterase